MKRLIFALFIFLVLSSSVFAGSTSTIGLFAQNTVAASGTIYSQSYDLTDAEGYLSIQTSVTGAGTVTIGYQMSNDGGATWTQPAADTMITGITSAASSFVQIAPSLGQKIRFYAHETSGTTVLVTAVLAWR